MRSSLVLMLVLPAVVAAGADPLSVKADPARPGRVIVGTSPSTSDDRVLVIHAAKGQEYSYYQSPDAHGFEICVFLRYARLVRTPGPIDVTVWRGDLSSPLRLEYDGRSCEEEPRPVAGSTIRRLEPLVMPTVPAAPTKPPEAPADLRLSSARLERVFIFEEEGGHRFVARFDRDVRLRAGTSVRMRTFVRHDWQQEVLRTRDSWPVRPVDHGFDWKTPAGVLRFEPPLRKGEKLRLSFEIEGRAFDRQPVTIADPS